MKPLHALGGLLALATVANTDVAEAADVDLRSDRVVNGLFDGKADSGPEFEIDPAALSNLCNYIGDKALTAATTEMIADQLAVDSSLGLETPGHKEARQELAQSEYDAVAELITSRAVQTLEEKVKNLQESTNIGGEGTEIVDIYTAMDAAKEVEAELVEALYVLLGLYESDGDTVRKVTGDHRAEAVRGAVNDVYLALQGSSTYAFSCPEEIVDYTIQHVDNPFPSYDDSKDLKTSWAGDNGDGDGRVSPIVEEDKDQAAIAAFVKKNTEGTGLSTEKDDSSVYTDRAADIEGARAELISFINTRLEPLTEKLRVGYEQAVDPNVGDRFRAKNKIDGKNWLQRLTNR